MAAFSLELAPWCRHSLLLKGEGAPRCSSGGCLGGLLTEILEGACLVRAAPQGITRLTVYRAHGTICALCRVSALLVPFVGAPWCAIAPTNEALAAGSLKTGGRPRGGAKAGFLGGGLPEAAIRKVVARSHHA